MKAKDENRSRRGQQSEKSSEELAVSLLEAEWHVAELNEYQRLKREQRERREWKATAANMAAAQEAEQLFKQASLYDGLGKVQQAIEAYQQFLDAHAVDDSMNQFAKERLAELKSGN